MKTSLYTILCTCIRLGAVWLAMNVILVLPARYQAAMQGNIGAHATLIVAGFSSATLLVAFLLWVYPGVLAKLAAGKSANQVFESSLSVDQIQQITLAVLGFWFVMSGLVEMANQVLRILLVAQIDGAATTGLQKKQIAELLTDAIQIVLGGALVLGGRGIVGLLHNVRYAGRSDQTQPD